MITVKSMNDSSFSKYGKVVTGYDHAELLAEMAKVDIPEDVVYIGSVDKLEQTAAATDYAKRFFGGMPIQLGYCIGSNTMLNAVEYHRNSEINIAVTDMILLLGMQQDINEDFTYQTDKIEAFLIPAGAAVELYATTLHYAPCNANGNRFSSIVILPKGTNAELTKKPGDSGEDKLMTAVNKWLIAHEDAKIDGAFNGLIGANISV